MATLLTGILFNMGCVSMKKRPQRLYREVVQQNKTYDAIIVPGVPFQNGTWNNVMRARVLWSYFLYEKGIARNIIYSGAAVYSPYCEAKIMGLYARQLGIPKEHIFYDTLALHSTENVYYAYELARNNKFKSIALATDPFQSSLLKGFTRKRFETTIQHIPVIFDSLRQYDSLNPVIDPAPAFKEDFISIEDQSGFWKRLKGTLGKNIKWDNKNRKAKAL